MKKMLFVVIAMMTTVNINAQIEEGNWYVTPKLGFGISRITGSVLLIILENKFGSFRFGVVQKLTK